MSGQSTAEGASFTGRWLATVLVTLLAFTWNGFVTQTHVHWESVAVSRTLVGQTSAVPHISPAGHSRDKPVDCPICNEIAMAGAYLASSVPSLPLPLLSVEWSFVTIFRSGTGRQSSHIWQSRAPPARPRPGTP